MQLGGGREPLPSFAVAYACTGVHTQADVLCCWLMLVSPVDTDCNRVTLATRSVLSTWSVDPHARGRCMLGGGELSRGWQRAGLRGRSRPGLYCVELRVLMHSGLDAP